ncbi:TRAP transporter large permease [Alsobacter metallidurans]|uniref:TRAP transporter large permease n=1 Tax=Alsobacter metallidurans TaxID=340221 RepID=UPI001663881F|nr:TRAP transporter large permease [Alsobacter metallidurans]
MSPPVIGAFGVLALFVLLFGRVPVWASLIVVGFLGNLALSGWDSAFALLGTTPFDTASLYTLSVIPLFIITGGVASTTGLSADLFKAARVLLSGVKGGLSIATICASACFGAVCGSSIATAATMTRISLAEMRKAGYADSVATGSIAAGGSLGILFPPSIILVIYAAIAEQSVPKLFAAGLLPGLILTLLYIVVAMVGAHRRPEDSPMAPPATARDRVRALAGPWQFLSLFGVTIGGIYAGIFSPTEAAAIGVMGAILLGVVGGRLGLGGLLKTVSGAVKTSCSLFAIIIGANLFSYFIVQTQVPTLLADAARALSLPGLVVMALVIVAYIIMGCFLEGIGMILITVPVFLPLVKSFGYDPVWFAIIVVIVVEVGLIHPPVGMNLFVIQAQAPDVKIGSIYRGILPYLVAPLILILLLLAFPGIALWLPKALYG